MKTPYITFIGVDGSGKTTTAKQAVDELNKQGIKAAYIYGGRIEFFFLTFLNKKAKSMVDKEVSKGQSSHVVIYKNPLLKAITPLVYYIEYFGRYLTQIRKLRQANDVVISDRGYIDVIVSPNTNKFISKALFTILPKPKMVYCYQDGPVILKRRSDHPEGDLLRQLEDYKTLNRYFIGRIKTETPKQTKQDVLVILKRYVRKLQ